MMTVRLAGGGAVHIASFDGGARWSSRCPMIRRSAIERTLDGYHWREEPGWRSRERIVLLDALVVVTFEDPRPFCRICLRRLRNDVAEVDEYLRRVDG